METDRGVAVLSNYGFYKNNPFENSFLINI